MKQVKQTNPRILKIRNKNSTEVVSLAVQALRNGSLVIIPTDTVYGIAADPRAAGAEERLYLAKGRDRNKPVPLLAASIAGIEKYGAALNDIERKLAERFWPGPFTLVLGVGNRTEGFRIPDFGITQELLRELGDVLRVTSANLSGEPPALSAEDAIRALGESADVVLDAGRSPGGTPSTVVKVERGRIKVLRAGAISLETLEKGIFRQRRIRLRRKLRKARKDAKTRDWDCRNV
jgi:L-threonylcarbamoyladenylate synthase